MKLASRRESPYNTVYGSVRTEHTTRDNVHYCEERESTMNGRSSLLIVACLAILALALSGLPIVSLAFADPNTNPELESESQWPSLGGDYTRSGLSPNEGLLEDRPGWTHEIGGAVLSSASVGSDGRVHVACEDGTLYTLDAGGAALWTADVNAPLLSAPSIGRDGRLFVGSRDGRLYTVDPNGRLGWTFETRDAVYSSPAVASNGNVYVGSTDGTLHALAADGARLWAFETRAPANLQGAVFASPSIGADGTVYVAGLYDPNLYALDPADGSVKWTCSFALYPENPNDPNGARTGGWPFVSPVVGPDGTIYQTLLYDSHLYAIEPSAGTILWSVDLLDTPVIDQTSMDFDSYADGWSEPVIGPDGTIYVSLDDPYLRAVNSDGTIRWATKLGDIGGFTLTVDANGFVYAACDDGYVYLIDADGQQIGRWHTAGWPAYPIVTADGTVLVTDSQDYSMLITDTTNTVQSLSVESLQEPAPEPAVAQ